MEIFRTLIGPDDGHQTMARKGISLDAILQRGGKISVLAMGD